MNLQTLGKKIAAWRLEQGLNQGQVSAISGVSRVTLSQLENGELLELGYSKVNRILACLDRTLTPTNKASAPTLDDLIRDRESEQLTIANTHTNKTRL